MFFERLFKTKQPKPQEENFPDRWKNVQNRPIIADNMPIEVRSVGGKTLLIGKLASFGLGLTVIERIPGAFSLLVLEPGVNVVVCGYNEDMETILFSGVVRVSTVFQCQVENLRLIETACMRTTPRLPMFDKEAELFILDKNRLAEGLECRLVNISTTGACVISQYCYPPDSTLRLRVELAKNRGPISLQGKIERANMRDDGSFEYGLLFAQLDQRAYHELQLDMQAAKQEVQNKLKSSH